MSAPSLGIAPRVLLAHRAGSAYDTLLRGRTHAHWLPEVEVQLERWLVDKKDCWQVRVAEDGQWSRGHRTLDIRHLNVDESKALRFEMREATDAGAWTTRLLAVDDSTGGWISLSITNDGGEFAAVPAVACYLLTRLSLRDGHSAYRDALWPVGVEDVDALMDVILDPTRRSPVFVAAGDPTHSPRATADQFGKWFDQTYGVGHAVLLDPDALVAFNLDPPMDLAR